MAYTNPNLLPAASSDFESGSHGWTAGSNTTLSVVSGQFLDGSQSLRLTPTAAGSASATSPRVLVAAGNEYVFRTPLRTSAATAGRVVTLTITWYDATSGGSSLGTLVSSLNVTSQSGWFSANYVVAVGVAPVGALSATLNFSVSGLAAGEYVNTDQDYAGVTTNRAGNLFNFNVSSFEVDTSGWAGTNATLARVSGNLDVTTGGYNLLGATSVAAGNVDIETATFYGVTAGQTYVSYAAAYSNNVATTFTHEIRWYDASDVLISAETRTVTAAITTICRTAVVGDAPVSATKAKLFLRGVATAASQIFYYDDVSITVAPNTAGNLLTYEEFSTESTLPAWTVTNATHERGSLVTSTTDGYFAIKVTPTASALITLTLDRLIPVTPGVTYKVASKMWRHNSTPETISSTYRTRVDWYDAGGNLFQTDNPDQFYTYFSSLEWLGHSNSETRTCPEGAAFARVSGEIEDTSSLADYYYVDNVELKVSVPEYTVSVDNDTASITLTVNSTDPDATTVTVQRINADGRAYFMRGYGGMYDKAPYTGAPMVIEDYEAPLGETVWYAMEWFNASDQTVLQLYTRTIEAPTLPDAEYVWFKSPGLPAVNTRVLMENPITWVRSARSSTYAIVGRRNPVHISQQRNGRTATISLLIWDEASHETFDALLDSGLPALIQAMPGYGINGNLYVSVGDVTAEPVSGAANEPGWRWTLAITEIDRPDGGLQGSAGRTWQTVNDGYTTWNDVFALDSWAEVLTGVL